METRADKMIRYMGTQFRAAQREGKRYISGYFAVFGDVYNMFPGATESIDPHAFDDTLGDDIRCLINHDTTLVMGRTKANTYTLRVDSTGLWGEVEVNEDDIHATSMWARVNRGDVDQCSIGFLIEDEEREVREDGSVHWTLKKLRLLEGSIVTFPAYEKTSVKARMDEYAQIKSRQTELWRENIKGRIHKWRLDS